jgi:hypothetical protein
MRHIKFIKEYFGDNLYKECSLDEYNSSIDEHITFNDRDKKMFDALFISLPESKLQEYSVEAQWGGENSYHVHSKDIFYPTCDMMDFPPEYENVIECIRIIKTNFLNSSKGYSGDNTKTFYIYKTDDEWYYTRVFLWSQSLHGMGNTTYHKCDQLEGLKQYLENEVISSGLSESLESSKLYHVVSNSMNYSTSITKVSFTEKDILFLKKLGITFEFMKSKESFSLSTIGGGRYVKSTSVGVDDKVIHLSQLGKSDKNDIIDILLYRDDDEYYYLDFYSYRRQYTTIFKCDTLDGLRQCLTDNVLMNSYR